MNEATLNSIDLNSIGGIKIGFQDAFSCSLVVSDYKWLTSTLKTAQQQFSVRPYYECRIIDDRLMPDTLTSGQVPKQGSMVVAPDGYVLAVGLNASNQVGFWKGNIAHLSSPQDVILDTDANALSPLNQYSINVSDFIKGTYKIDVYFFGSFNTGNVSIKHYYSLDGGITWLSNQSVSATTFASSTTLPISIAAGKPYQDNNGNIISTVFYNGTRNVMGLPHGSPVIVGTNSMIQYQQYPGTGTVFGSPVTWTLKSVDTLDWIIDSIACERIKGYWYLAFSGYHQTMEAINQNASTINNDIYITKVLDFQNSSTNDVWSPANAIITSSSTSTQNENSFTEPQLTYNEALGTLFVIFNTTMVQSITSGAVNQSTVSTTSSFYMAQSSDFVNFNYPQPLIFNNGVNYLVDSYANSIIFVQESNQTVAYISGDGQLGRMVKNNVVANISNDIISYTINENTMSPSSVSIVVGNANNAWYAGSPSTNAGYQAIVKNAKICVMQGYYTALGIPELAPRNTYYIDDIQQGISNTTNDFTLVGRDYYKNLKVLQTKFAYNFTGIKKYVDVFDGSTLGNYNQIAGSWYEGGNELSLPSISNPSLITCNSINQTKPTSIFVCGFLCPGFYSGVNSQPINIYPYYIDATHNVKFSIYSNFGTNTYTWTTYVNETQVMETGTITDTAGAASEFIPFMFVRYNQTFYKIYMGVQGSTGDFSTMTQINSEYWSYEYGMITTNPAPATIGFGAQSDTDRPTIVNFRYTEFDASQNIEELVQAIATKASIYSYKMPTVFNEKFYDGSNWTGTFNLTNRIMNIPAGGATDPGNRVYRGDIIEDGDITFKATAVKDYASGNILFRFIFRRDTSTGVERGYFIEFGNSSSADYISINSLYDNSLIFKADTDLIKVDFTIEHTYRVIFINQYIFVSIDGVIVLGWYENVRTDILTPAAGGQIGFQTKNNTVLYVKSVKAAVQLTQIDASALNPGDDIESAIEALLETTGTYMFSDLLGRFKVVQLNQTDPNTYTYQYQLLTQNVDNSDKEYVNQVTVVGFNNITATYKDQVSISQNGLVRESVINDNKITTYSAAYTRAKNELIKANIYNTQYNPSQSINLGSEMYDAVTVINTGANSSNVNQLVRNYSQIFTVGGDNIDYTLQIETGTL